MKGEKPVEVYVGMYVCMYVCMCIREYGTVDGTMKFR